MPKRSNSFQELISLIERQLTHTNALVTESAMVPEIQTENLREVDILIKCSMGIREVMIGIECRDHKRKADIQWIEQIRSKFDALPIDKRVAISRRGFTKHALNRAREWNIETISLSQAISVDWASAIKNFASSIYRMRFRTVSVRLACAPPKGFAGRAPVDPVRFIYNGIEEDADSFALRLMGFENVQEDLFRKFGQEYDWLKITVKFSFPPGMCHTPDELGKPWPVGWVEFDLLSKSTTQPLFIKTSSYKQAVVATSEGVVDDAEYIFAVSQLENSTPHGTARIKAYDQVFEYDISDFLRKSAKTNSEINKPNKTNAADAKNRAAD